ncbi:MAG: DUF6338 family protein [Coriobacteriia bacterium]
MVFGFDAIVASLVLVLPGFIVVGMIILLAPSWEAWSPSPATYVLLSLAASVPLHIGFAWIASRSWADYLKPWLRAFDTFDFSKVTHVAFTVAFLKPLAALLVLSLVLGAVIGGGLRLVANFRTSGGGTPSQKTVWRTVFEGRKQAPNVIVFVGDKAYKGQPRSVTTTSADPHLYLQDVSVVPVSDANGLPCWDEMVVLHMEGLLLRQSDIREMWFLND